MRLFGKKRFDFEIDEFDDDINYKNIKYIEVKYGDESCEFYYNILNTKWIEGMFMIKTISEIVYLHPFNLYEIRFEFKEILKEEQ